ncbi:hypothetical protein ACE6H2_009932 [Prunus campanulata]
MGSCQLGSSSICIKFGCSASSMLGWSRCSTEIERLNWVSRADPKLTSASACSFSARGTCWMVKVGNAFNNSWTLSRYKIILGCFAMVPSGVMMTTLAPAPFWFDAPSTRNCHMSLGWSGSAEVLSALELSFFLLTSFSSSADGVNSATKSAKAWAFIAVFGR